jgi:hypothetical protein
MQVKISPEERMSMEKKSKTAFLTVLLALVLSVSCGIKKEKPAEETLAYGEDVLQELQIDGDAASRFAGMALNCIEKEYPNKPSHVMNNEDEVLSPQALHPAFYGCFDWHSSVHGHWLLVRILKMFPDLPETEEIKAALHRNLAAENILQEVSYLRQPGHRSFERTYGWAWLLKLVEELHTAIDADSQIWRDNLRPLEDEIVQRYIDFLPKQTYPIRTGVHPNTAFGLAFALDYARTVQNEALENLIVQRSLDYFLGDVSCPAAWEPGGEDFFPPCLMEADLMRRVMAREEFIPWFMEFLPQLKEGKPKRLLESAVVTDRSDGKLVHLDGLNLSRAWCMVSIGRILPKNNSVRQTLLQAAHSHAKDALANIQSGDYAGEHWLASFAVFLLTSMEIP